MVHQITRFLKRNLKFFHPSRKLWSFTSPARMYSVEGISCAFTCFAVNISIFSSSENAMPSLKSSRGWIFCNESFVNIHIPDCESLMCIQKRMRSAQARMRFPNRCLSDMDPCFNAANRSVVIKSRFSRSNRWIYSWILSKG